MQPPPREEILSMLLEHALDYAVLVLDPLGTITWSSSGAEDILGCTREQAVGEPLSRFFTPEDVARGDAAHELEIARREGASEDDRWQQRYDGSRFWATGMLYALRDDDQNLIGFGKIFRNRTDIKEKLDTITNLVDALRSAGHRKDLYLATLSHELRSPLTPLRNAAELLRLIAPEEPRLKAPVELIERQVAYIRRLVDDLMDLTRISTGKLTLEMSTVALQEVLDRAAEVVRPLTVERSNQLDLLLHPAQILVRADPTRLIQVFVNLLTNAVKFTGEGGRVWLKSSVEGEEAVVRVEDDGIGIAPEMLAQIFDTFTQVEPSRSGGGLGLGLALVKELVTLHGGTVQVASEGVGKGSQFTVRLPLAGA